MKVIGGLGGWRGCVIYILYLIKYLALLEFWAFLAGLYCRYSVSLQSRRAKKRLDCQISSWLIYLSIKLFGQSVEPEDKGHVSSTASIFAMVLLDCVTYIYIFLFGKPEDEYIYDHNIL